MLPLSHRLNFRLAPSRQNYDSYSHDLVEKKSLKDSVKEFSSF